jgi:hypothetical protein
MAKPKIIKVVLPIIVIAVTILLLSTYVGRFLTTTSISFITRDSIASAQLKDDSLLYVNQDNELRSFQKDNQSPTTLATLDTNANSFNFSPEGRFLSYDRENTIYYVDLSDQEYTEQRLVSGGLHSWIDEDRVAHLDANTNSVNSTNGDLKVYTKSTNQTETIYREVNLSDVKSLTVQSGTVYLEYDSDQTENASVFESVTLDNGRSGVNEVINADSSGFGNGILAYQDNVDGEVIRVTESGKATSGFNPNSISQPFAPIDQGSFIYQTVEGTKRVIKLYNDASDKDETILELDNIRYVERITVLGETILLTGKGGTYVVEL